MPIHDTAAELGQRLGRAARPSEIAEALDVGVEVVLDGLAAEGASHAFSLDEPVRHNDGYGRERGRFGKALVRIEHRFDLVEHRESLGPLMDALPGRERTILRLRFSDGMTQTEIGQRVGLSQMHRIAADSNPLVYSVASSRTPAARATGVDDDLFGLNETAGGHVTARPPHSLVNRAW